ncbi:hypothetical protein D917_08975 [Trichinella nativa]|uniref:Uncharacterized protein n=1 Tax=Trichinella nativa TaxID=6335 RepID=A0A1Y3EHD3_9BILA|nr:hypothetical protein D917_08975 [Trichinella nativa]
MLIALFETEVDVMLVEYLKFTCYDALLYDDDFTHSSNIFASVLLYENNVLSAVVDSCTFATEAIGASFDVVQPCDVCRPLTLLCYQDKNACILWPSCKMDSRNSEFGVLLDDKSMGESSLENHIF